MDIVHPSYAQGAACLAAPGVPGAFALDFQAWKWDEKGRDRVRLRFYEPGYGLQSAGLNLFKALIYVMRLRSWRFLRLIGVVFRPDFPEFFTYCICYGPLNASGPSTTIGDGLYGAHAELQALGKRCKR